MKYKYGPLIWNCSTDVDESGNYYWAGTAPCAYDAMGIPIDDNGMQCLPIQSIIHPAYQPTETTFHPLISDSLPTISSARTWLDDNFLICTDHQVGRLIIRWYDSSLRSRTPQQQEAWDNVINTYRTRERLVDELWPGLTK
jgi:hypothetical protein